MGRQDQQPLLEDAQEPELDWQAFARVVLASVGSGVVLADSTGVIRMCNPFLEQMFGYDPGELDGNRINVLMPPYEGQHHDGYIRRYLETRKSDFVGQGPREIVAQKKDGTNIVLNIKVQTVQTAGTTLFVAVMEEPHKEIRGADLANLAEHDMLTGLYNYYYFQCETERLISRIMRGQAEPCALLYIDLDGFRAVNERHGHAEGDRVLMEFASHIAHRCRKSDLAARLHADKFAVLLYGIGEQNYQSVAESFRVLTKTIFVNDGNDPVRASAALIPLSRDADGFRKVIDLAEATCRSCKTRGGDMSVIFRAS